LNSIHPDDRDRVAQVWQTAVETCSLYETEYRLRVAPGVYHDFLARGVPVLEPDGTLREWVGTCTDITEAKQLEARRCQAETALQRAKADLEVKVQARTLELQKLNQELMRSNQELEKFALVVSHDLQEPLRTIRNHVQLLREEQQQEQPNPDLMQESIDFVVEGSVRMQQLIRDLLTYARVGQGTIDFQVNCNIVLDQVLSNLGEAITQSQALISCEPLPILTADKTQLLQLFQNLISNAIKFCQGKQPQIDIGCIGVRTESPDRGDCWIKQAAQTEWLFWVKDNGIGIQAQYLDSVFDIFKRCHPQQAYPGTGMGLAICKKIIEQRGGKIWMESIAGAGTTVYFTIAA
jgi:light-regulated signal transduction histidine kinase (bacteriophytochrome)